MNSTSNLALVVYKNGSADILDKTTASGFMLDNIKCWDNFNNVKMNSTVHNMFEYQPEPYKQICALVLSTDEWIVDIVEGEVDPSLCYFTEWFYVPSYFYKD